MGAREQSPGTTWNYKGKKNEDVEEENGTLRF